MTDLEKRFHRAMLEVYEKAKTEAGYNAVKFLQMVTANGGLETAKTLINSRAPSAGYTALWEKGRLDLSVEAVILDEEGKALFSERERRMAEARLRSYGWTPKQTRRGSI